jgi:sugar/nucleoside kinase (ribokinase family)
MAEHFQVAVIGHLTVDDIVLPNGSTKIGSPGGNVLYAALGAKAWGVNPLVITCQGKDYPSETMDILSGSGIDTSHIIPLNIPTVRQWALYDVNGGRKYVPINKESNYLNISPRPHMISDQSMDQIQFAHIAPMPAIIQEEWVDWLTSLGVKYISLDPHEDYMSDDLLWKRILPHLTIFMPSTVEVEAMSGDCLDELKAARRIAQMGPGIVVIKLGANGSLVYERDTDRATFISPIAVAEVDPTGCGDSYCGGFLAGMMSGGDPVFAAKWGSVSASFVLEGYGPTAAYEVSRSFAEERYKHYDHR